MNENPATNNLGSFAILILPTAPQTRVSGTLHVAGVERELTLSTAVAIVNDQNGHEYMVQRHSDETPCNCLAELLGTGLASAAAEQR